MVNQSGLPGQRAGESTTPRNIVASYTPRPGYVVGGIVLDTTYCYDGSQASGDEQILRAGTPMAKITATGLWAPCKRTLVTGTGTLTDLVVDDSRAFQVGDTITIGSDTDVDVTAINYSTNTLTIASTAVVAGEAVFVDIAAQVGLEICRGFLNEHIDLVDSDHIARDKFASKVINRGHLDASMILGDLTAIRADSGAFIDGITWDDESGNA